MSVRRDPFEQMEEMFEQMRRAMFQSWEGRPALTGDPSSVEGPVRDAGITLEESEDGYVVLADLPGFERDEIDLTYDDGALTIAGSHEVSDDDGFRSRRVHETVRVPGDVVVDDVTATYHNGVLEVSLPVADGDHDRHRIDIE